MAHRPRLLPCPERPHTSALGVARRPFLLWTAGGALAALTVSPLRAAAPAVAPTLRSRRQTFRIYYGAMTRGVAVGNVTQDLKVQPDGRYEVTSVAEAEGLAALVLSGKLVLRSAGRIEAGRLLPERYSERRGARPEKVVEMDYAADRLRGRDVDEEVPLLPGTQDRLSVYFDVGLRLSAGAEMRTPGAQLPLALASWSTIEQMELEVVGDEELEVLGRSLAVVHLRASYPARPERGNIALWLARELDWLPVRIQVLDDKRNRFDQILTDMSA